MTSSLNKHKQLLMWLTLLQPQPERKFLCQAIPFEFAIFFDFFSLDFDKTYTYFNEFQTKKG